ncbi:LamG-like jellyroll fold domain-containing protein [Nanoarchaeota archaeon]
MSKRENILIVLVLVIAFFSYLILSYNSHGMITGSALQSVSEGSTINSNDIVSIQTKLKQEKQKESKQGTDIVEEATNSTDGNETFSIDKKKPWKKPPIGTPSEKSSFAQKAKEVCKGNSCNNQDVFVNGIGGVESEVYEDGKVKLSKWDDAFIEIEKPNIVKSQNTTGKKAKNQDKNKIRYETEEVILDYYIKEVSQTEEGFEYEIILKSLPTTNVIELEINTTNLKFYYQPPLNIDVNNASCNATNCEGRYRPIDVVGSYAVYHASKKDNEYTTGKAFHIYRPLVIDANNNTIWGDLNITDGKLKITIDQDWLDNAAYPVVVDPTFGYTTIGGSMTANIEHWIQFLRRTMPENGTAINISAYYYLDGAASHNAKANIYDDGSGVSDLTIDLISGTDTEEVAIGVGTGWHILDFNSNPTLVSGTTYRPAIWIDGGDGSAYMYYDETLGEDDYEDSNTYGTWPDPITISDWYINYSVTWYINYDLIGPTIDSVILNATSAGNLTTDNLTAWPQGAANYATLIYDWRKEGTSIAVLNMPFDTNVSGAGNTVKDYSGKNNNGTLGEGANTPTWNATGISGGSYDFYADYINISDGFTNTIKGDDTWTMSFWAKVNSYDTNGAGLVIADTATTDGFFLLLDDNGDFYYGVNGVWRLYDTNLNLGTWYHYVFTKNGAGDNGEMYINGTRQTSWSGTIGSTLDENANLYLGTDDVDFSLDGQIDEFMIFNRTLSVDQIQAMYNSGVPTNNLTVSNETQVGEIWQACVTPNDATQDGNTVCSNNVTILEAAASTPTIDSVILNATSSANVTTDNLTAYPQNPSNYNTLIHDWRKEGTSIAVLNIPFDTNVSSTTENAVKDYSTYANNGTLGGGTAAYAPTWNSSGISGGAYLFDGANDEILISAAPELRITTDISIFAWVKVDISGKYHTVVSKDSGDTGDDDGASNYDYVFGIGDVVEGDISLYSDASGFYPYIPSTGTIPDDGDWHHIGVTRSGSAINYYIDGANAGSRTNGNAFTNGNYDVHIGHNHYDAGNRFEGLMDGFIISDKALSAEQVAAIYNSGTPRTNLTVSNETTLGQNWSVCVTPNDATQDGPTVCSNNLTIIAAGASTYTISNAPTGTNWVLANNTATDVTSTGQTGIQALYVGLYSNYTARVYGNFTANIDVSGVTINTTKSNGRSLIYNTSAISQVINTTLLIPRIQNSSRVFICPDATTMNAVNESCTNISWIHTGQTKNGMTVSEITIDGQYYYEVKGITGTGGGEPNITSVILNATSRYNLTTDNLTAWPQNAQNYTTLIYDWRVEGTSRAVVNMPFDTNNSAGTKDYSSFNNNGTIVENVTWISNGASSGAYDFPGTPSYISIPYSAELNITDDITIALWINPDSLSDYGGMVTKTYVSGGIDFDFYMGSSGHIKFWSQDTSPQDSTGYQLTTGVGTWLHIAMTRKGSNLTFYLNGEVNNSMIVTGSFVGRNAPLIIGTNEPDNDPTYAHFNGQIDGVLVYNYSLSPEQIAAMYNSGTPRYNLTASQETKAGENWTACVTPNDATMDGPTVCSNNITILEAASGSTGTVCINETGVCWANITAAIANATAGQTVIITNNSIYNENVTIDKSLVLTSNSTGLPSITFSTEDTLTISSENVSVTKLQINTTGNKQSINCPSQCNNITFSNVTIYSNATTSDVVYIDDASDIYFQGAIYPSGTSGLLMNVTNTNGFTLNQTTMNASQNFVAHLLLVDVNNSLIIDSKLVMDDSVQGHVLGMASVNNLTIRNSSLTTGDLDGYYALIFSSLDSSSITIENSDILGHTGIFTSVSNLEVVNTTLTALYNVIQSSSGLNNFTFDGVTFSSTGGGQAWWMNGGSVDNLRIIRSTLLDDLKITDDLSNAYMIDSNISSADIVVDEAGSYTVNFTLINSTYNAIDQTACDGSPDCYMYVKWYQDVYVNNSGGTPLSGAEVNITDKDGLVVESETTAGTGYISRRNITELKVINTAYTYMNNHTINVSLAGYTSSGKKVNITSSRQDNFTLTPTATPTPVCIRETSECWANITAAIDNATAGQTVVITDSGTYNESILVDKDLTITSNGTGGWPTIQSTDASTFNVSNQAVNISNVHIITSGSANNIAAIHAAINYMWLNLTNATITLNLTGTDTGAVIEDTQSWTYWSRMALKNVNITIIDAAEGIVLNTNLDGTRMFIDNVRIEGSTRAGMVYTDNSLDGGKEITNSYFNQTNDGVQVIQVTTANFTNTVIATTGTTPVWVDGNHKYDNVTITTDDNEAVVLLGGANLIILNSRITTTAGGSGIGNVWGGSPFTNYVTIVNTTIVATNKLWFNKGDASQTIIFNVTNSSIDLGDLYDSDSSADDYANITIYNYLDVHVQDSLGSPINTATVNISDVYGTLVASTTTAGTGNISKQTIKYGFENHTGLSGTIISYSNHSINVTMNGYIPGGASLNMSRSKNITITLTSASPSLDSVILNATSANNLTTDNLTAYPQNPQDYTTLIYDWRKEGTSTAVINIPFEADGSYNATDYSDNGHSATNLVGSPIFMPTGGVDGGGAYNFTTSDTAVSLNTTGFPTIGTGNFTLEMWIKTTSSIAWQSTFAINKDQPEFYIEGGDQMALWDEGGSYGVFGTDGLTMDDGNWHHVAWVREGTGINQMKFYLDGSSAGTSNYSDSIPSATSLLIGHDNITDEDWEGLIDNVHFYDYALSFEQINATYNSGTPRYNLTVSNETSLGENWSVCVTPNDATQDGTTVCSNNITILAAATTYTLDIITPNQTVPKNVNDSSNISIYFNFTENSTGITSGLTIDNITIGGKNATIIGEYSTITYVNGSTNTEKDVAEITVTAPVGIQDGDFIFVQLNGATSSDRIWTLPAGFVTINNHSFDSCDTDHAAAIGYKLASGESGDYVFNINASEEGLMVSMIVLRGVDTENPFDVTYDSGLHRDMGCDDITPTNPAITTQTDGAWVILTDSCGYWEPDVWGAPSGYDLREYGHNNGGNTEIATKEITSAGTETPGPWTNEYGPNNQDYVVYTIAIRPAYQQQFSYVPGQGWEVNVTVPAGLTGLQDLTVNATYSGNTAIDTEIEAIDYGGYPKVDSVLLNATSRYNLTTDNLKAWPQGASGYTSLIYNWKLNGEDYAIINVPFEASDNAFNATDYAGYDNNGTSIMGSPDYYGTAGPDGGGAYDFTSAGLLLDDTTFPAIGSGNYTLEAWVNLTDSSLWSTIVDFNYYDPGFYATSESGDDIFVFDGGYILSNSGLSLDDSQWHHVAFVREGTGSNQLKFYMDGASIGTATHSASWPSITSIRIGNNLDGDDFDGLIDNIRFYNRSLTKTQIQSHYNGGAPRYNITVSNETQIGQVWQVCITPVNATEEGTMVCSNTLTILEEPPPTYSLDILTPNQTAPQVVSAGDNISIYFNFTEDSTPIISGVTIDNVTIGGTVATILNTAGTPSTIMLDSNSSDAGLVANPSTWSHTVGAGDNRMLIVAVQTEYAQDYVSGITWGDQSLVLADRHEEFIDYYGMIEMWYLLDPDVETNDISVTWATAIDNGVGGAWSITGANQSAPITNKTNTGTSSPLTIGIDTVRDNSWIFGSIVSGSNIAFTEASGQNESWDLIDTARTSLGGAGGYEKIASAGATEMSWTFSGSPRTVGILLAVAPAESSSSQQFKYVAGQGWQVNVTVPSGFIGLQDLFVNATYSGSTASDQENDSINYTGPILDSVILNATSPYNLTTDNLTAWPQNALNYTTLIYDWRVEGTSRAVLNMPFDKNVSTETTDAVRDYTTFENNGTLTNGSAYTMPTWTSSGISGGAYEFDGDDIIRVANDPSLNASQEITIMAWIKPSSLSGRNDIFKKSTAYWFNLQNTGKLNTYLEGISPSPGYYESTSSVSVDSWSHIATTYNGSEIKQYINGSLDTTHTGLSGLISYSTSPINIGFHSGGAAFNGTLDEIRIYTTTLSTEQIQAIYNSGTPKHDLTVNQETSFGENWSICVTPNDASVDGTTRCSNNLTIMHRDQMNICNPPKGFNLNITTTVECNDTTIQIENLTVTGTGKFLLNNVTLIDQATLIQSSGALRSNNSLGTFWQNDNLTISGEYNLTYTTLRMNVTTDGEFGINVTSTGTMNVMQYSNVTNGETAAANYRFNVHGTINASNSHFGKAGWTGSGYQGGIYVDGTGDFDSVNITSDNDGLLSDGTIRVYDGRITAPNNAINLDTNDANSVINNSYLQASYSLLYDNAANTVVTNNDMEGTVQVQGTGYIKFKDNNITATSNGGIRGHSGGGQTFNDSTITLDDSGDFGILTRTGDSSAYTFKTITITGIGTGIIFENVPQKDQTYEDVTIKLTGNEPAVEATSPFRTTTFTNLYINHTGNATNVFHALDFNTSSITGATFILEGVNQTGINISGGRNVNLTTMSMTISDKDANAIWLDNQDNVHIDKTNITATANTQSGIIVGSSDSTNLSNIRISMSGTTETAIQTASGVTNLEISDSTIYVPTSITYGLSLFNGPDNLILRGLNVTTYATALGLGGTVDGLTISDSYFNTTDAYVAISMNTVDNIIFDNIIADSDGSFDLSFTYVDNFTVSDSYFHSSTGLRFWDVINNTYFVDSLVTGPVNFVSSADDFMNATFINTTYDSIVQTPCDGTPSCDIYIKWYQDVYVNDTNGDPVSGAEVNITDKNSVLIESKTTLASGYIVRRNLTELNVRNNAYTYMNNYTITATLNGYTSDSLEVNITGSRQDNLTITLITSGGDNCGGSSNYTSCVGSYCMDFVNTTSYRVVIIDDVGDVDVVSSLTEGSVDTSAGFVIHNSSGSVIASINDTGSLGILGTLTEGGDCTEPNEGFVIRNSTGSCVAFINSTGGMYIAGNLCYNSDI